jgi:hypothetical protein
MRKKFSFTCFLHNKSVTLLPIKSAALLHSKNFAFLHDKSIAHGAIPHFYITKVKIFLKTKVYHTIFVLQPYFSHTTKPQKVDLSRLKRIKIGLKPDKTSVRNFPDEFPRRST